MDNLPDREASIRKRLAHAQQPTAQEIGMTFAAITYASDIAFLLAQSAALRDQLVDVRQRLAGAALCEGYANRRAVVAEDQAFATLTADLRLAQTERDQLRDQLARVTEALYDEVRHPINAKGGAWTDEEIRYYLSAKWGLTWAALAARTPTPGAAGEVG